VYHCWWKICREINVFSRFECHVFYALYSSVTYLLTLPRIIGLYFILLLCKPNHHYFIHFNMYLSVPFLLRCAV
jgi:hypothetical protein